MALHLPQPGQLGNHPADSPNGFGLGLPYANVGSNLLTSGQTHDAQYNMQLRRATELLGPPPKLDDKDPRARFPRELITLPELWSGPDGTAIYNPYLTEFVMFFEDEQMKEIIKLVAPVVRFSGNPVIKGKMLIFNRAKLDEYTHTGTPRLVSQSWETWETHIRRYGLGGEFDEERIGEADGNEIIRNTIRQIQIAVLDHCGIDCIYSLLYSRPQPNNFYDAHQLPLPAAVAMDAMEPELEFWGCITKTPYGLAKLCTYAQAKIQQQMGSAPDIVIMPQGLANYFRFARPELTDYNKRGPVGPDRQEQGGNAVITPQLGGLKMVGAPLVPAVDGGQPRDPLEHLRMIGEFFNMSSDWHSHIAPPPVAAGLDDIDPAMLQPGVNGAGNPLTPAEVARNRVARVGNMIARNGAGVLQAVADWALTTLPRVDTAELLQWEAARTIYIHDNLSDTMQPITMHRVRQFLFQCIRAHLGQVHGAPIAGANALMERVGSLAAPVAAPAPGSAAETVQTYMREFVLSAARWRNYDVALVRPNMLYGTSAFIYCKSGGETAQTHVGFGDCRFGREATRKKALIHYTTYAGCVVRKPQNVWVANCAQVTRYFMGGGIVLGKDMFPILVRNDSAADVDKVRHSPLLGITSDAFTDVIQGGGQQFLINTDQLNLWAAAYGFRRMDNGFLHYDYKSMQERNVRVFRGPCEYATLNSDRTVANPRGAHVLGTGHWGPWAYDGVGKARLGKGPTPYVQDPYFVRQVA